MKTLVTNAKTYFIVVLAITLFSSCEKEILPVELSPIGFEKKEILLPVSASTHIVKTVASDWTIYKGYEIIGNDTIPFYNDLEVTSHGESVNIVYYKDTLTRDWCTLTGNGKELVINLTENTSSLERTIVVTACGNFLADEEVKVVQAAE